MKTLDIDAVSGNAGFLVLHLRWKWEAMPIYATTDVIWSEA